jgi:hypothetical protein
MQKPETSSQKNRRFSILNSDLPGSTIETLTLKSAPMLGAREVLDHQLLRRRKALGGRHRTTTTGTVPAPAAET